MLVSRQRVAQALKRLQTVLDSILSLCFGFTTLHGSGKEREEAKWKYEKSAQVVTLTDYGSFLTR